MPADILSLRQHSFVLWRVTRSSPPPELVIGQLQPGAPVGLTDDRRVTLKQSAPFADLWIVAAADCHLVDDEVYYYWFEVTDAHPKRSQQRIRITDPLASMVDWRLRAPQPSGPQYTAADRYPASVVKSSQGTLIPCDAGGETGELAESPPVVLSPNNRIVIYELPTAWARIGSDGSREQGVGTFRDVTALVEHEATGANFAGLSVTERGRSYLAEELGVNALELLPPRRQRAREGMGLRDHQLLRAGLRTRFPV